MLLGIVLGCITGALWEGAAALEPLGTVFINLMFCIVVPLVFDYISGEVDNTPHGQANLGITKQLSYNRHHSRCNYLILIDIPACTEQMDGCGSRRGW